MNEDKPNQQTPDSFASSFSSSENKPENDFDDILNRMRQACGVKSDKKLAEFLDVKYSSITTARKRGAIPSAWYLKVAEKFNASMDWLRTGVGEMKRSVKFVTAKLPNPDMTSSQTGERNSLNQLYTKRAASHDLDTGLGDVENFDMGEVLGQTIDILNSKTVYTTAIVSNIKAFHKAIATEKKIEDMQEQLGQALASFSSFQAQLDKTNQTVSKLQSENEKLRQELEQTRAGSTLSDTG